MSEYGANGREQRCISSVWDTGTGEEGGDYGGIRKKRYCGLKNRSVIADILYS